MNPLPGGDDPFVAAAILEQILKDRAAESVRSLAEYQALFPGHEALVAREFAALESPAGDAGPAATTGAGTEVADPLAGHDESPAREFLGREEADANPGPIAVGDRVAHYRIEREIGRGGQGLVFLAFDTRLRRRVALKVISNLVFDTAAALARFQREAMVASRLNHPGICKVHDASLHGGSAYIAMEFVEGETLARQIAAQRSTMVDGRDEAVSEEGEATPPLPDRSGVERIVRIMEQVARALGAAHESGVIHRDIKPGNIMITAEDRPVILDFGLARELEGDLRTLTRTGELFGTPSYMAPELLAVAAARPDHRADIWSLGVCLHECLSLRRPFEEPTRERLYQAILTSEPSDVRSLNPAVSRDVKVIVETALAKNPDGRYQTAVALADDLRAALDGRPIAARPVSSVARLLGWAKRRPAAATLALVLLIGVPTLSVLTATVIASYPRWEADRRREQRRRLEAHLTEALHRLLQWNFTAAITAFRQALDQDPDSVEALGGLALVYLRARMPERALEVIDRHRDRAAGSAGLDRIRADALIDLGRKPESDALASHATAVLNHTDHFLLGVRILIRMDVDRSERPEVAFDHFTLAAELFPHEPRILYSFMRVVSALAERDDVHVAAARRLARVMAIRWPDHHLTWYARGAVAPEDRVAIGFLERCLRRRPDFVLAHGQLSYRFVTVDPEKALEHAEQALARAPDWPWAYAMQARAYRKMQAYDRAIEAIQHGIDRSPSDPLMRIQLGRIWVARHDWPKASQAFESAVARNPNYYGGHSWLGYALTAVGDHGRAMAAHRRAVALAPRQAWPVLQMGRTARAMGDLDGAIAKFTTAVGLAPESDRPYRLRAEAREARGDLEGASEDLQAVLALQPGDERTRQGLRRLEARLRESGPGPARRGKAPDRRSPRGPSR